MIRVHVYFRSGKDLDLDVEQDILLADFMDLVNSIGGPVSRLEFLP